MIFFLQFSLNFSDLLIRVLAEKFLTSFCVCIKKAFRRQKNREGVVIVNTAPGLFGQYSSFLSEIIQIEEAFGIPFFQSTKGLCYCRTALNNALGGNVFSYESLGVANIDNINIELEETAIQASLESKGVRCDSMNSIRDLVLTSEINSVGTWILRNNNT